MTSWQQPVIPLEPGGQIIDTVEAALDYVFGQFESNHAQAREAWAETYNQLAQAADSGLAADLEAARYKLVETINWSQLRSA